MDWLARTRSRSGMKWAALLVLAALLWPSTSQERSALAQTDHQVCSTVTPKSVKYGNSALLECPSAPLSWWRSKTCDDITSFESYSSCVPSGRTCLVPVDSYRDGHYYYCCAEPGVATLTATAVRKCFKISICTMVTHSSAPPFVLNGTTATIYVDITAEPRPSDGHLTFLLNGRPTKVDNASLVLGEGPKYTKVYEFRVPSVTAAVFMAFFVKYSTSVNCTLRSDDMSVSKEFEIKKVGGSLLTETPPQCPPNEPKDSTSVSHLRPTPAVNGDTHCDSSQDKGHEFILVAMGIVILFLLIMCCVCGGVALFCWAWSRGLCRQWGRKDAIRGSSLVESPYDISSTGKVTYRYPVPDLPASSSSNGSDSLDSPSADI